MLITVIFSEHQSLSNNYANSNKSKIKINEINIESSPKEKLLGVILDDQLNFKSHMSNLCKMALNTLTDIEYSCTCIFFNEFP